MKPKIIRDLGIENPPLPFREALTRIHQGEHPKGLPGYAGLIPETEDSEASGYHWLITQEYEFALEWLRSNAQWAVYFHVKLPFPLERCWWFCAAIRGPVVHDTPMCPDDLGEFVRNLQPTRR